ncbi:anaphase-promoting complex subunit 1-like [Olea europaea subsp. europaea]|uniref:Anaphase-promoting complex subunit 1-like n=1 Tax=Olea europaea subsp. europaea TaxID=158383 RepID=A0A8S0STS2_OLEEU|nr:anaphase-promoting complex subunit 1-like [Olea europaea subsp. europaea]
MTRTPLKTPNHASSTKPHALPLASYSSISIPNPGLSSCHGGKRQTMSTPSISTTITASPSSSLSPVPPSHLLEVSLISAQDLAPLSKSMRMYALTWVHPNRKLSTATDKRGHNNPTWNSKFAFPIDDEILESDNAAVTVEIYTLSWFRDVLVGTVQVLVRDLINPLSWNKTKSKNIRFVALQVRRPSGSPQGILNMGVRLLNSSMRSMPLPTPINPGNCSETNEGKNDNQSQYEEKEEKEKEENELEAKVQLGRSLSLGSEVIDTEFPLKQGSVCNGSMVNGSELCSDIGPSASIVAAELAMNSQPPAARAPKKMYKPAEDEGTGSSILGDLTVEEARAKGYGYTSRRERRRTESAPENEIDGDKSKSMNRFSRRNSEGDKFSCFFGKQYGIQFTISCGAPSDGDSNKKLITSKSRSNKSTEANSA